MFKHGDRITCTISDTEIDDARICVYADRIYIVQNKRIGAPIPDKARMGYRYSYILPYEVGLDDLSELLGLNIKLKEKSIDRLPKVGDRIVIINPEFKWGHTKVGDIGTIYSIIRHSYVNVEFDNGEEWSVDNKDFNIIDIEFTKGEEMSELSTADKLFNSKLSEDEKTLREAGLKDNQGRVTHEGERAMMDFLYEQHGKKLASQIRELDKDKKESKS